MASYDGSTFAHGRFIRHALGDMVRMRSGSMSVSELLRILDLVDNYALSSAIYYDSSVPREIAEGVQDSIAQFSAAFGISDLHIRPASTPDDLYEVCLTALDSCRSQIAELDPTRLAGALDQPLRLASVRALTAAIDERLSIRDPVEQQAFAESTLEGELHGRKLLAGLFAPQNDDLLQRVSRVTSPLSEAQRSAYWGVAFNVQGAHFLNSWAEALESAYLTGLNAEWRRLLSFSDHVWAEFLRGAKGTQLERAQDFMETLRKSLVAEGRGDANSLSVVPPVALTALMERRVRSPGDLLHHARESIESCMSGKAFRQQIWKAHADDAERQGDAVRRLHTQAGIRWKQGAWNADAAASPGNMVLPAFREFLWKQGAFQSVAASVPEFGGLLAGVGASYGIYDLGSAAFRLLNAVRDATGKRGFITYYCSTVDRLRSVEARDISLAVKRVFGRRLELS